MTALISTESYAIGWIAALPTERAAATAQLDDRHEPPEDFEQHPSDTNSYTWGRMCKHNIVIASLPAGVYGTTAAATTASNLLASLPAIKIGLLVGIGGGIARHLDQDVRLGDVVVSQPKGTTGGVIQYDLGKARLNGKWEPKGMLNKPPKVLLNALAALQAEHEIAPPKISDLLEEMLTKMPQMRKPKKKEPGYAHQGFENDRLFASSYGHIGGPTCDTCDSLEEIQRDERDTTDPEIHYGIIASGNTLVKDASNRDKIAESTGSECLCVEMEAAGLMDHFPCLVIRGICDYADSHKNDRWRRYASATAAAYAKELLEYVPAKMLEKTTRAVDILKSVSGDVKSMRSAVAEVQVGVQSLDNTVLNIQQTTVLNRLRVAEGASFDSSAQEHDRHCLPNTRVELLQQVSEWAKDLHAEPIFWLNGMAGTGKSTISRTVARSLADNGQLGASFFFKKGETDRGSLSKFFMTIAADLIMKKPSTAPHIEAVLNADHSITSKNYTEQFQKFLLEPLTKCDIGDRPVVIVVDALDECEQEGDIERFLYLVSRLETELPDRIRIFLTSRPEEPFRSQFKKIKKKDSRVILHEIPKSVVEHDIDLFLRYELYSIRADFNSRVPLERHLTVAWPSESSFDRLMKMAVPLFIVAATLCRFISDNRIGTPKKLLERVLSRSGDGLSQLETTYQSVLDNQISARASVSQRAEIIQQFRQVVGCIILLASPLSTSSLAVLLIMDKDDIDSRLDLLHSVLSIPASAQAPLRKSLVEKYHFFLRKPLDLYRHICPRLAQPLFSYIRRCSYLRRSRAK
ncbi:uncharacterized protein LMH87_007649 [Akanthomyces muscarius]|uniref:NACHT domain-containing protein n=1 Tax=Akanthomyces muscarius TaxID=2231603 RepID=A0A9W8URB9_AKAMU|nr:uncharacterized protein LMH87_007649 [Akanthomyces muscarius]KAJ4161619.1 hypothetical protein LMH87_007649 [Akanthomyces muscarius]